MTEREKAGFKWAIEHYSGYDLPLLKDNYEKLLSRFDPELGRLYSNAMEAMAALGERCRKIKDTK